MIDLIKGECIEIMKSIPNASIDAIITDPPYGTTACKWDSVIPFEPMWEQLNRIIKPNGAIVLFGSEPFSSALRFSNIKNYKYDWIWEKDKAGNFALANRMPMKYHEIISVFYKKQPTYNKQRIERSEGGKKRNKTSKKHNNNNVTSIINGNLSSKSLGEVFYPNFKNPSSVLKYNKQVGFHPTQKPVALMEYLIKTYTNENETVLDFTMGSGSTMVACQNTNRNGIGIEQDENYFEIAQQRIKENEYKLF